MPSTPHPTRQPGELLFPRPGAAPRCFPSRERKFVLRIVTPLSPETEQFSFPAEGVAGEQVFEIGLTGSDWPGKRPIRSLGWSLSLLQGQILASAQSFLWSKDK